MRTQQYRQWCSHVTADVTVNAARSDLVSPCHCAYGATGASHWFRLVGTVGQRTVTVSVSVNRESDWSRMFMYMSRGTTATCSKESQQLKHKTGAGRKKSPAGRKSRMGQSLEVDLEEPCCGWTHRVGPPGDRAAQHNDDAGVVNTESRSNDKDRARRHLTAARPSTVA